MEELGDGAGIGEGLQGFIRPPHLEQTVTSTAWAACVEDRHRTVCPLSLQSAQPHPGLTSISEFPIMHGMRVSGDRSCERDQRGVDVAPEVTVLFRGHLPRDTLPRTRGVATV